MSFLGCRNEGAQQRSACALWDLAASHPGAPGRIVNAGAISPLVALLGSGTIAAKEAAVGALSCLAQGDPSNQLAIATGLVTLLGAGSAEGQVHVTQMLLKFAAENEDNRRAIAEAGAIERLVMQIKGGGSTSLKAQELAAAVLKHLSGDSVEHVQEIASKGGIKPLIALLGSTSPLAQAKAAAVLADMCASSSTVQILVAKEGAIEPLVHRCTAATTTTTTAAATITTAAAAAAAAEATQEELGRGSSGVRQTVQEELGTPLDEAALEMLHARSEAAGALWALADGNAETQELIFGASAIGPLVQLLRETCARCNLKGAGALASLARGSRTIQEAIRVAGGVLPLVRLLEGATHDDEVRAHAAKALGEISREHGLNQTEVARAGGIPRLVWLLEQPGVASAAREEAAAALWALAAGPHAANQELIQIAGGIAPLVALVGAGGVRAQREAAGALAAIALEHPSNRDEIATQIVGLLGQREPRETGAAAARKVSFASAAAASPTNTTPTTMPTSSSGKLLTSPSPPRPPPAAAAAAQRSAGRSTQGPGGSGSPGMSEAETAAKAARAIASLARSNPANQVALPQPSPPALLPTDIPSTALAPLPQPSFPQTSLPQPSPTALLPTDIPFPQPDDLLPSLPTGVPRSCGCHRTTR